MIGDASCDDRDGDIDHNGVIGDAHVRLVTTANLRRRRRLIQPPRHPSK